MISLNSIIFSTTTKLILAVLTGYLLGHERDKREKSAGSRTMALVCLGSALTAVISLQLNGLYTFDFSRMIAYLLPAISFIGAGVITKNEDGVDGITTSASLFSVVPLGILFGLGYFGLALITAILIYLVLESKYLFNKEK